MTSNPIHIAMIAGHPVRFFRSPINDGRQDFPWHAVDDLMAACRLGRSERRHFMRMMQRDHKEMVRTVATADGIVTVAPHPHAQGLVDAMVEVGRVTSSARNDYDKAIFEASEKAKPGGLSINDAIAAFHRWSDGPTGASRE